MSSAKLVYADHTSLPVLYHLSILGSLALTSKVQNTNGGYQTIAIDVVVVGGGQGRLLDLMTFDTTPSLLLWLSGDGGDSFAASSRRERAR